MRKRRRSRKVLMPNEIVAIKTFTFYFFFFFLPQIIIIIFDISLHLFKTFSSLSEFIVIGQYFSRSAQRQHWMRSGSRSILLLSICLKRRESIISTSAIKVISQQKKNFFYTANPQYYTAWSPLKKSRQDAYEAIIAERHGSHPQTFYQHKTFGLFSRCKHPLLTERPNQ